MIMALMEGADADKLLAQTKTLNPDAEITHCFLQVIPLFRPRYNSHRLFIRKRKRHS